ncbi:hypothetical protein [Streptomyces sp. NBC_01276]|uniref:hypothetical protein n=1 Tax=Streptomyces sp. NBC_01276 TaxID=2903808 RepID=UPI00352BD53C
MLDGQGPEVVRDLMWERADAVVRLDFPRPVVMLRVLRRSLRRSPLRERLFGGNRERWRAWLRGPSGVAGLVPARRATGRDRPQGRIEST